MRESVIVDPYNQTVLETPRLVLRHLVPGDATALEGVFCDSEVMRFSDGLKTPEEVRAWLDDMIDESYAKMGFGLWGVVEKGTGEVFGYCGLDRDLERCGAAEGELGYRLVRRRWGCGYATEAAAATCEYGLTELGLSRVVAMVDPGNGASVRVLQKIGLLYAGEVMFDGYTHPDHLYVTVTPSSSKPG